MQSKLSDALGCFVCIEIFNAIKIKQQQLNRKEIAVREREREKERCILHIHTNESVINWYTRYVIVQQDCTDWCIFLGMLEFFMNIYRQKIFSQKVTLNQSVPYLWSSACNVNTYCKRNRHCAFKYLCICGIYAQSYIFQSWDAIRKLPMKIYAFAFFFFFSFSFCPTNTHQKEFSKLSGRLFYIYGVCVWQYFHCK